MNYGHVQKRLRQAVTQPVYLPAVVACLLIFGLAIYSENQSISLQREEERAGVQSELGLVRARLEGAINADIQLMRGLVALVETEPDLDQARLNEIAPRILEGSHIRNIAVAPDLVVSMVYPMEGNKAALGLDYRNNPAQRPAVMRARVSGNLVLAGPVELVQGGTGFIGRFPVFTAKGGEQGSFWGLISAVIDAERLYQDGGLLDPNTGIEVAIAGRDAGGTRSDVFFGNPMVVDDDPVTARIYLPSGSWLISARPRGGWDHAVSAPWRTRVLFALVGLAVALSLLAAGRFSAQRTASLTALRLREEELETSSRRLGLALTISQMGIWELDIESGQLSWDRRLHEIYGVPYSSTPKQTADWTNIVHPDDRRRATDEYQHGLKQGGAYISHFRIVRPDGEVRYMQGRATLHVDAVGRRRMTGVEWDVTEEVTLRKTVERSRELAERRSSELEEANRRIAFNALHDPLTGLPNRRQLDETLDSLRSGKGDTVALLHLDLDRFKQNNDTLGHQAGDAMLVHAATVLKENVGEDDLVARVGGDEFVVLCRSDADGERLAHCADRLVETMRQPVPWHGHECRFGVSIGIASSVAGAGFDPAKLMVDADIALYRAKNRGRNRFEFFTESLEQEIVETKRLADDILSGLERGEFVAWYQPQICARTFDVIGFEALARWNHPTRGVLTPDLFLHIAEDLNVVAAIDHIVLQQALAQRETWRRRGAGELRVSVNVSARRLSEDGLIATLREMNIPAGVVSFELVESIFMDESDELISWNVDRLKDLGIDIEIDDFGTGHASIVSLLNLKPRRLKIDRQLVRPIIDTPGQRQLVESIIEIGKSLDIEVVAEGVESLRQARMLRDMGCDFLQGYAFAKPMSGEDFDSYLRPDRPRHVRRG